MKNYSLNKSKNVITAYKQEMHALKNKQGNTGLTEAEKERLRDLSKIIAVQDNQF
jgi:hypothetical protein